MADRTRVGFEYTAAGDLKITNKTTGLDIMTIAGGDDPKITFHVTTVGIDDALTTTTAGA